MVESTFKDLDVLIQDSKFTAELRTPGEPDEEFTVKGTFTSENEATGNLKVIEEVQAGECEGKVKTSWKAEKG